MGALKRIINVQQRGEITSLNDVVYDYTVVRSAYTSDKQQVRLTVKNKSGVAYDGIIKTFLANHAGVKYLRHSSSGADGTKIKGFALVSEKGTAVIYSTTDDTECEIVGTPNASGEFFVEIDNSVATKTEDKDVYVVFEFADKSIFEKFKLNPAT